MQQHAALEEKDRDLNPGCAYVAVFILAAGVVLTVALLIVYGIFKILEYALT